MRSPAGAERRRSSLHRQPDTASRQAAIAAANTDDTTGPTAAAGEKPAIVGGLDANDRSDPNPSDSVTVPQADPCITGGDGPQSVTGSAAIVDCPESVPEAPVGDTTDTRIEDDEGGPVPGVPASEAVDPARFCQAAVSAGAFELELAAALMREDMIKTRDVILAGRDQWRGYLADMGDAGPADLAIDLEFYEAAYGQLIDPVEATTTGGEMLQLVAALNQDTTMEAGRPVTQAIASECY